MLDRICQYSTIIFAGNVAVLIIVSVATDYWEYRGFQLNTITNEVEEIKKSKKVSIESPGDTQSYFTIKYTWNDTKSAQIGSSKGDTSKQPTIHEEIIYQSPALLKKLYTFTYSKEAVSSLPHHRIHNKTGVTVENNLVLFCQYGNLFRDCDMLEVGVRTRLGLTRLRRERCFNFITTFRDNNDYIYRDLPSVIHLERVSFLFAIISIVSSVVSVGAGGYGSLTKDKLGILTASSSALISGISLTVTIALFHGKCHLIHRRQFMQGYTTPFTKIVDKNRQYTFGWSFVLAWICVVLCFIHTWVWLLKAQDMPSARQRMKKRRSTKSFLERDNDLRYHDQRIMLNPENA